MLSKLRGRRVSSMAKLSADNIEAIERNGEQ
jgi:hypothetical protein